MNEVFHPYLHKVVLVFFDDTPVYSLALEDHKMHLAQLLELLQKHQLYVDYKKCEFGKNQVAYLGHIISAQVVATDLDKVKIMIEWPTPSNIKELQGFLGLTRYYRKFVVGYAHIALLITGQLKKDRFGWNLETEQAFQELKQAMSRALVLAMPDFSKPFIIETDALSFRLGPVLLQRPITFYSYTLSAQTKFKSVYEKELMAIVFVVIKWSPYLLGRHFVVHTDQQSLKYLLEQRVIGVEHQRWITKLKGYDFEIQYRSDTSNRVATTFS